MLGDFISLSISTGIVSETTVMQTHTTTHIHIHTQGSHSSALQLDGSTFSRDQLSKVIRTTAIVDTATDLDLCLDLSKWHLCPRDEAFLRQTFNQSQPNTNTASSLTLFTFKK